MKKTFLFYMIFLSASLQAQSIHRLVSFEQVVAKKVSSVVMIEILNPSGEVINKGAGFFIDSEGHLITNHHVIEPFEKDASTYLQISDESRSEKFTKIEMIACSNRNKIDLCLLKITGRQAKEYIPIKVGKSSMGETLYSIGHCQIDFNKKYHELVAYWRDLYNYLNQVKSYSQKVVKDRNFEVETVEVSRAKVDQGKDKSGSNSAICPGDSGGPLINSKGELVAVVAELVPIPETKELIENLISGQEVAKYVKTMKNSVGILIPEKRLRHKRSYLEEYDQIKENLLPE